MADEENERKAALIALITAAFQNAERGNGVSLHEADVIDDYGSAEERAAARLLDTDRRWQDVPETEIRHFDSRISFLDAEGFRYYAPVCMLKALKYHKTPDSASDFVLYAFDPRLNSDLHEHKVEKFSLFTREQSKTICCFLKFMSVHGEDEFAMEDAIKALTGYWEQFCNAGH